MKTFLRHFIRAAMLVAVGSTALGQNHHAPAGPGFHPPGMWTWDNWFHDGRQWHAFYLQLPRAVGLARRWKDNDFYKHVGHATSPDLRTWQDQGPALCALSDTWNDRHIATGSIARHAGRWWMAFTGRGTKGDGVGLAVSDDLMTWLPAQERPLFALTDTWGSGVEGGIFSSPWKDGTTRRWVGISDPYLMPEPVDGWFLMVLCARILDVPLAQSGCLTVVRSKDLRHWEKPEIVAWPGCFERMETPQLWQRHQRWYLSFGGVLENAWVKEQQETLPSAVRGRPTHQNYYYILGSSMGPADEATLQYVAVPKGHYIMKVLPLKPEQDVAIFTVKNGQDSGISAPYPVEYGADGALKIR